MSDVFTYTDYRKLLADYYTERKKQNPGFSYQVFASKAGFPNRGFLYNVITGIKSLSKSSAVKLSQAMKLTAAEADYFENLVSFNQAKNLRERNYFFEKLNAIKSSKPGSGTVRETRKEQYDFYSIWYISAIRSLIDMHPFKDGYDWLAGNVYPPIKPKEAKKAVMLLQKLGMIKKRRDGTFEATDKTITAGSDVVQLGLLNFQVQTTELALRAIREMPKEKRNISGLTMGISRKSYETVCAEISAFQARLQAIAEQDNEADNVYQLNFHFFPISNVNGTATGRQGWRNAKRKQP
ncbi:MAG: TIGR02147 family protein [Chitinispirillaceae bacterium]|nr:TIGR02147 family protein [Chitinispirillaceae bacterium]